MPKFTPKRPFELFGRGVDGPSHFGNQTKTSQMLSDLMKLHIEMGGVDINVYRFKGIFPQDSDSLGIKNDPKGPDTDNEENLFDVDDTREDPFGPDAEGPTDVGSFLGVQDTILNEDRDREYDFDEIPILRGVYTVSQNELEFARFGMALGNDVIQMEFHTQTMERELGRRLVPGDVVEMPHLREVGVDGRVANKWYQVASIVWSPTGYDPMYGRHISAVTMKPLRHQQEFLDLFERQDEYGRTLAEQMSNREAVEALTEANQEIAREHVNTTWWDTTILWFDPDHPSRHPFKWTDDGKPDNGIPVQQGTDFPGNPAEGEWFVRVDFVPNRLFRFENGRWRMREIDRKREWQPYNWIDKLREHMSDRSEEDKSRPWKLRSIHDVLTPREELSEPSPEDPQENKEPFENVDNDGQINPRGKS